MKKYLAVAVLGIAILVLCTMMFIRSNNVFAAACDCVACHGQMHNSCADWGADTCNACHGNPPSSNNPGPGGMIAYPSPTGMTAAGAHMILSHRYGGTSSCQHCHYGGMPMTPVIGDNKIQIGISIAGFNGAGTSYDGYILNPPYSYVGTNGTTTSANGSGRCFPRKVA